MSSMSSTNRLASTFGTVLVCASALVLGACSSSSSGGTTPVDGGTDAFAAPPPEAGPLPNDAGVAGCTEADFAANDHTAPSDARLIQGPNGASPLQYTPHCMRVRASQTLTIQSNLSDHPIDIVKVIGPDPYPITTDMKATIDGGPNNTETVTIAMPGVVKFNCDIHPTEMFGAIEVVP